MGAQLKDVLGVGHALVDVLAHADEQFLARHGLAKGSMTLVDAERAERLHAEMTCPLACSGGSAANTMVGLASLGSDCAFIGKVGDDEPGRVFRRDIREAGVEFTTEPSPGAPPTGRCLVLVTPDAQRTMATFLGASAGVAPADIDPALVQNARITYLEGYLWDRGPAKQAFLHASQIAHAAGRRIALSLSDSFCVDRHREEFRELVADHVDVLLANEDEVVALFDSADFESALRDVSAACAIAALTRGAAGSVVVRSNEVVRVEASPVARVVDTTGAGDLYAAGFLHGLSHGMDLASCARIGSLAAAAVIGHFGARPRVSLRELAGARWQSG